MVRLNTIGSRHPKILISVGQLQDAIQLYLSYKHEQLLVCDANLYYRKYTTFQMKIRT
jgi:hypothetical protein